MFCNILADYRHQVPHYVEDDDDLVTMSLE
jgi:hypothetical protein